MKNFLKISALSLPLLLAACGGGDIQSTLGLNREAPDEFTVVSRPPLTVPPEFTLRPPEPGAAPLGTSADVKAREALTGKSATTATLADPAKLQEPTVDTAVTPVVASEPLSGSAESFLKRAGADQADENIRDKLSVDERTPRDTSNAKSLMEQITGEDKNEPTVDAKGETERLRANKDAGKPINEGEVPENKPKEDSLIDRIF